MSVWRMLWGSAWWVLLACCSAVFAQVPAPASLPTPIAVGQPAPLTVLSEARGRVSLDGRSQWWIDPGGRTGIDELAQRMDRLAWLPRTAESQFALDGAALWVRFEAQVTADTRWFLELASSGIDHVQFYSRDAAGRWRLQEAGDAIPVPDWPLPGRFATFELRGPSAGRVEYLVRVAHARVVFATPFNLLSQAELVASRDRQQLLLGAYFGLALLAVLVSLAQAVFARDAHFGVYALYVTVMAAGQAAFLGLGAQYLWPHALGWNAVATFVLPHLTSAAGLFFLRQVIQPGRLSHTLDLAFMAVIAAQLVMVAVDGLLPSRNSHVSTLVLSSVALWLGFVLLLAVWRRGDDPDARLIMLGFLPVIVGGLVPLARSFGLIPFTELVRYALPIGAAIEIPILFYALSVRQARRRDVTARANTLGRNDPLTGMANLAVLQRRLDRSAERAAVDRNQFGLLLVELANHAQIRDSHGAAVAERALVVAATGVRALARNVDLAARVDTAQFALVHEGPVNATHMTDLATRVVAGGLRPSSNLPPDVSLRLVVAMALLPDAAVSGKEWTAENAVQRLRPVLPELAQGKRSIRSLNF